MTLIRLALAWTLGLMVMAVLHPPTWPFVVAGCCLGLVRWRWPDFDGWRPVLAMVVCFALGAGRAAWADRPPGPGDVASLAGPDTVALRGLIAAEPIVRDRGVDYRLAVSARKVAGGWDRAGGVVLLQAGRYPQHAYGETVVVSGTLEAPRASPGFDYAAYLARQGIHVLMRRPRFTILATGGGNPVRRVLLAVKDRARQGLSRVLPEPEASLATGILLGDDNRIPRAVADAFRATNTTHIIAISGSNIALLVAALMATVGALLGRRRALPVVLVVLVLYTALVGADAAVVRAALMGGIMLLGVHLGRPGHAATALAAACWAMTAWRPAYVWDLGFQLSFAATAGLIAFSSRFGVALAARLMPRLGEQRAQRAVRAINETVLVTLAAQLTTWPIIAYQTGQLSLVGLAANFLILPAQPPIMGLGALAALAGVVAPDAGRWVGALAWLPLAYTIRIVEAMARAPLASVHVTFGLVPLTVYFAGLLVVAGGPIRPRLASVMARVRAAQAGATPARASGEFEPADVAATPRTSLTMPGWLAGWLPLVLLTVPCVLVWIAAWHQPDGRLHVFALDVGQGDSILVVTPGGRRMLVDGGPAPSAVLDGLGRRLAPWDRRLDVVVLTHPDADHVGGLPAVLDDYTVAHIVDPQIENGTGDTAAWRTAVEHEGAAVDRAAAGGRIELDAAAGVSADILWPPEPRFIDSDRPTNNNAVVLRLTYGAVTTLLTADIEAPVEAILVQSGVNLRAAVLKVGHHGSRTSSTPEFLAAVAPWTALISVGADNTFGHPAPETLAHLAAVPVWRTDQHGTVEMITDGHAVWVR